MFRKLAAFTSFLLLLSCCAIIGIIIVQGGIPEARQFADRWIAKGKAAVAVLQSDFPGNELAWQGQGKGQGQGQGKGADGLAGAADPAANAAADAAAGAANSAFNGAGSGRSAAGQRAGGDAEQAVDWSREVVAASKAELQAALAAGLQQKLESFTVVYAGAPGELDSGGLSAVMEAAIYEDDYTAYTIASYAVESLSSGRRTELSVSAEYREQAAQSRYVQEEAARIVAGLITPDMGDHQKIKQLHDWIVLNVKYDESLQRYTAYEALTEGTAVCQGYALLAHAMLAAAGVENRIVEGTIASGNHAWNLVKLGDSWYHLDTTSDDPVPDEQGRVRYGYYMKADSELQATHRWEMNYPAANQLYYEVVAQKLEGELSAGERQFFTELERDAGYIWLQAAHIVSGWEQLARRLEEAIDAGERRLEFRYLDGAALERDFRKAAEAVQAIRSYQISYVPFGQDGSLIVEAVF